MKVYGKYLVKAYVFESDRPRIAATFNTFREAKQSLDRCFKRINENLWVDNLGPETGNKFFIEKNTKEYK